MGTKSGRHRLLRRRRQRAGFAVFASLVVLIFGSILFFGADFSQSAAQMNTAKVEGINFPTSADAPEVVSGTKVKEAAADKKAGEEAASKEAAAKKDEKKAKNQKQKASTEPNIPTPPNDGLYLTVPKIGRQDDYVANTDDSAAMDQGAIKLPASGFPWQPNANTYIAAHVLGYAGTGSYLQFANLPNMSYGDKIYLTDSNGTTYTYEVTEILTVTPNDSWVTGPVAGKDIVSLQTCVNPPAYDLRLIVRGERVDVQRA